MSIFFPMSCFRLIQRLEGDVHWKHWKIYDDSWHHNLGPLPNSSWNDWLIDFTTLQIPQVQSTVFDIFNTPPLDLCLSISVSVLWLMVLRCLSVGLLNQWFDISSIIHNCCEMIRISLYSLCPHLFDISLRLYRSSLYLTNDSEHGRL